MEQDKNYFFYTAWKVSVIWVFLVRIFPHSGWIRRDISNDQIFNSFSSNVSTYINAFKHSANWCRTLENIEIRGEIGKK